MADKRLVAIQSASIKSKKHKGLFPTLTHPSQRFQETLYKQNHHLRQLAKEDEELRAYNSFWIASSLSRYNNSKLFSERGNCRHYAKIIPRIKKGIAGCISMKLLGKFFKFLWVGWDWVKFDLLHQLPMFDDGECGVVRGLIGRGNRSTRRKPAPVSTKKPGHTGWEACDYLPELWHSLDMN
jgi:hypothetical protein